MKTHLSYWQDHCTKEKFNSDCGDFDKPFKNFTRSYIKEKGYKSVFDCGAGLFSEYFGFKSDGIDVEYTGADITQKYVKHAIDNKIHAICCSGEDTPFADKIFDCSFCHDVINHQKDFRPLIKELLRVTRKEVIISFFKPFCDEDDSEIRGSKFKVSKKEGVGYILDRVEKDGKPVCIYNFISRSCLESFLENLGVEFTIHNKCDRNFLFIKK